MDEDMTIADQEHKPATIYRRRNRYLTICINHIRKTIVFILPSFTQQTIERNRYVKVQPAGSAFNPTEYLDGLRGFFSFLVFLRHFLLPWEANIDTGYAQMDTENNMSLIKLPILRLVYAGPTVPIFFIVSSFVLAYKPLKLIRQGDLDGLGRYTMSSVLRRPFRLFLPPLLSTLLVALAVRMGLYKSKYTDMPGWIPRHPELFDSMGEQLWDWLRFVVVDMTHPWSWKSPKSEYNSHLWTIPIQFRASLLLYLTLLALSRTRVAVRAATLFGLCLYSLQQERWEMYLFFAGAFLAERQIECHQKLMLGGEEDSECGQDSETLPTSIIWKRIQQKSLFLLGMYVSSYPRARNAGHSTPGYISMSMLTDRYVYWQSFGATLLCWSLIKDTSLQRSFVSAPVRYLGRISFSLYLVHGPILHLFGYSMVSNFHGAMGKETWWQYQLGILSAFAVLAPVTVWIADLFWRAVEEPCATLVTDYIEPFFSS